MALMAAEELGIPYDHIRCTVADTATLGYNEISHGSRVTYASGLATIKAARDAVKKLSKRAADKWEIPVDAVKWDDGHAVPSGPNAGDFKPLSLKDLTKKFPGFKANILGALRKEKFIYLKKNDTLQVDDNIYLVVSSNQLNEILKAYHPLQCY